jgi:hypothetical protein
MGGLGEFDSLRTAECPLTRMTLMNWRSFAPSPESVKMVLLAFLPCQDHREEVLANGALDGGNPGIIWYMNCAM